MSKTSVATESIYGFAPKQTGVSPEEPIFVLTSSQLQEIISRAVRPLQDEALQLKSTIANLEAKVSDLESTEEQDVNRLTLYVALDRQRIAKLEQKEPQPLQRDRGEILRALLVANNGKMLAKEARLKMHLDRATFSRLLVTTADCIEVRPYHLRKNQKVLILK